MSMTQEQVIDHLRERHNISREVFEEIHNFSLDHSKKLILDFLRNLQSFHMALGEKYEALNIDETARALLRSSFSMNMLSNLAGAMIAIECKLLGLTEQQKNGLLEVVVDSIVSQIDQFLDEMPNHSVH